MSQSRKVFYVTSQKLGSTVGGKPVVVCPDCGKNAIKDKKVFVHALVFSRMNGFYELYNIGSACGSYVPFSTRLRMRWEAVKSFVGLVWGGKIAPTFRKMRRA